MFKLFIVSCGLIFLAGCSLFGMQGKSPNKAPLPLAESVTIVPVSRVVNHALFMPVMVNNYQLHIDPLLESSALPALINQIEQIPTILSTQHNQVDNLVIETSTNRGLLKWRAADGIFAALSGLSVGESVVNIPSKLIDSNYQYIILARLTGITINHSLDNIPDTKLTSLIAEANLELEVYLISVSKKLLLRKFSVVGHASRANLIFSEAQTNSDNFQPLLDGAFNNVLIGITANLAKHNGE